ncbi:ATP-dependent Clp protease proteolytic subunit [Pirellulaceae bacterium]|jgi:ATP-dependent protease ClpP protease subunit|nr:ATP-dependent Clp protease proteolytic subunit [Pirellulaceae bacterium]
MNSKKIDDNDEPNSESANENEPESPAEIAIVGDLSECEKEVSQSLLDVPVGGECTLFFNCPGGSAYSAVSLLSIISSRKLNATGIVTGECSSAALWPFAACQRRLVSAFSFCLFHPMKWQSEESVQLIEATEWTRHFTQLELKMDELLAKFFGMPIAQLKEWSHPGRYISGTEMIESGLAEPFELIPERA